MQKVISAPEFETSVYRKITWRIMPFLFFCYVLAYVDRVNVGFAKLQMQQALGMSDAVYGMGAGIFFIGYFLFEVPANMLLQRIGARLWIGPIMMTWGVVSAWAGYASPHAVGLIRDRTHSMVPALLVLCGAQLMTAILILIVARKRDFASADDRGSSIS